MSEETKTPPILPMVEERLRQLEAEESIIQRHRSAVSESVAAFRRIRDGELWRAKCKTLAEYIGRYDNKLGLKRLYQLDEFERHESEFEKLTGVAPPNERVHREIKALGKKIPDETNRHKVFKQIAALKKITTTGVRNVASAYSEEMNISGFGDDYPTPDWLYRPLDKVFRFEVDVAANKHNAKCQRYFTQSQSGLKQDWTKFKSVWCNPPFSQLGDWVMKGYEAALHGTSVAIVAMHNTESGWFQTHCFCADLLLVNGRVTYEDAGEANRFGTIVILFHLRKFSGDDWMTLTGLENPKNERGMTGAMLYEAPVPMAQVAWDNDLLKIPGVKTEKQFMEHFGYRHVRLDGDDYWL